MFLVGPLNLQVIGKTTGETTESVWNELFKKDTLNTAINHLKEIKLKQENVFSLGEPWISTLGDFFKKRN